MQEILTLHNYVNTIFRDVNQQNNLSLASKYLHFHFPELFFIMDKRTKKVLRYPKSNNGYYPEWSKIKKPNYPKGAYNLEYYRFCMALIKLRDEIYKNVEYRNICNNKELNPRQIDTLLLNTPEDVKWNNI